MAHRDAADVPLRALADALQDCIEHGIAAADECVAMTRVGVHAAAVAGYPANIKITAADDLELAAPYLAGCAAIERANQRGSESK